MTESDLRKRLIECEALRFGEFTLSSGKKSSYYVDIKMACTDPEILSRIAVEFHRLMRDNKIQCDRIAGVVLGSIPLAVALSLETGIPFVMVRKDRKDHGTGRMIEGRLESGDRVVVIEDVVTSASSVVEAVLSLREAGAEVDTILAVVDRQEGAMNRLEGMGVRLISLLKASDLKEDRT